MVTPMPQATIQRSIDPFYVGFACGHARRVFTLFDRNAKRYGEGPGGPNYEMKVTLCFLPIGSHEFSIREGFDLSPFIGVQAKPIFVTAIALRSLAKHFIIFHMRIEPACSGNMFVAIKFCNTSGALRASCKELR